MALKIENAGETFGCSSITQFENLNSNRESEAGPTYAFILIKEVGGQRIKDEPLDVHDAKQNKLTNKLIHLPRNFSGNYGVNPSNNKVPIVRSCKPPASTITVPGTHLQNIKLEPASSHNLTNKANNESAQSGLKSKQSSGSLDFKEDLKKKILERRRAEGKQMIDLAQEEENRKKQQELDNHLTKDDVERRLKKRSQNNMAAKRCRENKKQVEYKMIKDMEIQVQRKKQLLQALVDLTREKEILEDFWKECNSGVISPENKRFIQRIKNTDFANYIPKPLPPTEISLESDSSYDVSDMDSIPSSQESIDSNVSEATKASQSATYEAVDEVSQSELLTEMFKENSRRREVHSEESMESCSSADDNRLGSDTNKERFLGAIKKLVTDLTKSNDSLVGGGRKQSAKCQPTSTARNQAGECQPTGTSRKQSDMCWENKYARNTLFELADVTYTEMKAAEKLIKVTKVKQDVDYESDEEEVPLVIDLAK